MYYQSLTVVKPVHKSFIVLSFQMPTIALFLAQDFGLAMSLMLSNFNNASSDIRHKGVLGYKRLCPIKVLGRIGDFEIFRIFQIFISDCIHQFGELIKDHCWLALYSFVMTLNQFTKCLIAAILIRCCLGRINRRLVA